MPDYQGNHKILRVYMVLGDAVSKLEMFVWILKHISRSITWFLYTLKASYLVKWPISTRSFMWWCQFIDELKFETCPSSLMNFGTASTIHAFCWFFRDTIQCTCIVSKWHGLCNASVGGKCQDLYFSICLFVCLDCLLVRLKNQASLSKSTQTILQVLLLKSKSCKPGNFMLGCVVSFCLLVKFLSAWWFQPATLLAINLLIL